MTDDDRRRLPLPSEDTGDLVDTPPSGDTDDYLVAREEGVPYRPPTERVVGDVRLEQAGPDQAGVASDASDELARSSGAGEPPVDDALVQRCLEALRASDLPAGDHLRIAASGHVIHLRGEVESIDILDEIQSLVADVPGVEHVVDETTIRGM